MLTEKTPQIRAAGNGEASELLTPEALEFVGKLEREFGDRRLALLVDRAVRQRAISEGERPEFLAATESVRLSAWRVAEVPDDLQKRHVEITGPTDAKMLINALNSGADVFMADFEDANSPTWLNMVEGQLNVRSAVRGTLSHVSAEGKRYELNEQAATLMVRPRGWHLDERHVTLAGRPVSASLFDFALFAFHNAQTLVEQGSGPYLYIPKLESHLEARLWNDVLNLAEDELDLKRGTFKVTVLIETILAAFEMDEILYELREHIVGLNAGRWDYIFSIIKKFSDVGGVPEALLPDRSQITMTVPFMRAYTELLVKTCHRRGAHAMGGMAAFIPSRKDQAVNEAALARVRQDKQREAADGFDGTWVAHPDLVAVAREVFDQALQGRPHQKDRLRDEVSVSADDLLNFDVPGGRITQGGVQLNIAVALRYLEAWLGGQGAVAINNLMEDTATAEISRAQLWQWVRHPRAALEGGAKVTIALCREVLDEQMEAIRASGANHRVEAAAKLLGNLITDDRFAEFLTLAAQDSLDALTDQASRVAR